MKADEKVCFEEGVPTEFTEFEYLSARVSHIEEVVNAHADVMRDNNLVLTELKPAPHIDEEEVFDALEGK